MDKKYLRQVTEVIKNSKPDTVRDIERSNKGYFIGNEDTFEFVAALKGIEGFDLLIEQELQDICHMWYEYYREEFEDLGLSSDEVWLQFLDVLPKIKFINNGFNISLTKAELGPEPPEANQFEDKNIRLLISFCFYLQQTRLENQSFWLSGKDAGWVCNKSQTWGSWVMRGLVRCGILRVAKKGHTGRATEYQYVSLLNEIDSESTQSADQQQERKFSKSALAEFKRKLKI